MPVSEGPRALRARQSKTHSLLTTGQLLPEDSGKTPPQAQLSPPEFTSLSDHPQVQTWREAELGREALTGLVPPTRTYIIKCLFLLLPYLEEVWDNVEGRTIQKGS